MRSAYAILMLMKRGICHSCARRAHHLFSRQAGFTVVETIIVLAITGALFVAIAGTLAGKQNTAEFKHAIQSMQSQIQQTISEVSAGFYPNSSNFTCVSTGNALQISSGSSTQGTNQDCVFLGKVIQLGVQGTTPEQYQTYTIAGLRAATVGTTSPFQNASPTIVNVGGNYASYSTATTLDYGLTTAWVKAGSTNIGAVGFLMEPGSLNTQSASGYNSGAQQVDLIPLPGTSLGQSLTQGASSITSRLRDVALTSDAPINPSAGVQICFVSGGTNQSGLITIGGSGRQLLVTLSVKANKTCS